VLETLEYIYRNSHENYRINLNKIIKQKASSYIRFIKEDYNLNELQELESKGLIASVNESQGIILPLGYGLLERKCELDAYSEYDLLKEIYNEVCISIIDNFKKNNYTNQDCVLAIYILFMGSCSENEAFPFKMIDKTFQFFSVIQHDINYIFSRLFYYGNKNNNNLKDSIMLRNWLGRNGSNGNIKKITDLYDIKSDQGLGIKYLWFDIKNVKEDVNKILTAILNKKENIILILNLKKAAMDYLLVNTIPYEMKLELGERTLRNQILEEVIEYCNIYIEKYSEGRIIDNEINIENLTYIERSIELTYENFQGLYKRITEIIENSPKVGLILIECHYRLRNLLDFMDSFDDKNQIDKQLCDEKLGKDFNELIMESSKMAKKYILEDI
jgi:hypothetical protein